MNKKQDPGPEKPGLNGLHAVCYAFATLVAVLGAQFYFHWDAMRAPVLLLAALNIVPGLAIVCWKQLHKHVWAAVVLIAFAVALFIYATKLA